jgi:hypothetical protein
MGFKFVLNMNSSLFFTIIALIAGSVGSVALAGLLLLFKDDKLQKNQRI